MGWEKPTGEEVDSTSLEHQPHGGAVGVEGQAEWIAHEAKQRNSADLQDEEALKE